MKRKIQSTVVALVFLCVASITDAALQTTVTKYAGTLPCADCAGIRTVLTLYSEPGPTRYELVETYLGTRDGDRSVPSSGRWTVLRGSATDPDATVYQLDFDRPDRAKNFLKDGEYQLALLDRLQAVLPMTVPHFLTRVSTEAMDPLVLTEADSSSTVRVRQGQWVIFRFPSNPSTGFRWALARTLDKGLRSHGEPTYVRDISRAGVGATGIEVWTLSAERTGEYQLQFVYRRPWEANAPSQKNATFVINVVR